MPIGDKNGLPYRRQQSIESNRRRWANGGCPESTRQKISASMKAYQQRMREEHENGQRIC